MQYLLRVKERNNDHVFLFLVQAVGYDKPVLRLLCVDVAVFIILPAIMMISCNNLLVVIILSPNCQKRLTASKNFLFIFFENELN